MPFFNYGFSLVNKRCALAELFTEGSCPFDFAQLLQYRNDEYDPAKVLEKIEDSNIKVSFLLRFSAISFVLLLLF